MYTLPCSGMQQGQDPSVTEHRRKTGSRFPFASNSTRTDKIFSLQQTKRTRELLRRSLWCELLQREPLKLLNMFLKWHRSHTHPPRGRWFSSQNRRISKQGCNNTHRWLIKIMVCIHKRATTWTFTLTRSSSSASYSSLDQPHRRLKPSL